MLIVYDKEFKVYTDKRISQFEDAWLIGGIGKAYLRSIVEAKSKHSYKDWMHLGFSCLMRDKMEKAAKAVNDNVNFIDTSQGESHLDAAYWTKGSSGSFECKTTDYAKAVSAVLANSDKNGLECASLTELMALRALQLAVGNEKFNELLKRHLGIEKLKLENLNEEITEEENLIATTKKSSYYKDGVEYTWEGGPYDGDLVFRPGDIITVGNRRREAENTPWLAENGICIGWKLNTTGGPDFNEPLFVGGGTGGNIFTEAKIKAYVYDKTKSDDITGDIDGHFREKALDKSKCNHKLDKRDDNGKLKYGTNVVPDIYLNTDVKRISILGGRRDLG